MKNPYHLSLAYVLRLFRGGYSVSDVRDMYPSWAAHEDLDDIFLAWKAIATVKPETMQRVQSAWKAARRRRC